MPVENRLVSGNYSTSINKVVFGEIPCNSYCLDVGCWNGNLGYELIKSKGCKVDGVDVSQGVLQLAKDRGYSQVFPINLNGEEYDLSELPKNYDVIVFADVLEHLIDPLTLLRNLKNHLSPAGFVIVSLPNVAFLLNRILLCLGKWDYTEFGTLDKTHLKFFTLKTAKKLLEDAGYKVEFVRAYNQFKKLQLLDPLLRFIPGLLGYQILLKAYKS